MEMEMNNMLPGQPVTELVGRQGDGKDTKDTKNNEDKSREPKEHREEVEKEENREQIEEHRDFVSFLRFFCWPMVPICLCGFIAAISHQWCIQYYRVSMAEFEFTHQYDNRYGKFENYQYGKNREEIKNEENEEIENHEQEHISASIFSVTKTIYNQTQETGERETQNDNDNKSKVLPDILWVRFVADFVYYAGGGAWLILLARVTLKVIRISEKRRSMKKVFMDVLSDNNYDYNNFKDKIIENKDNDKIIEKIIAALRDFEVSRETKQVGKRPKNTDIIAIFAKPSRNK